MIKYFLVPLFATATLLVSCSNQQTQTKVAISSDTSLLSAKDFSEKIRQQSNAVIIDVRTPEEYAEGHIPNAKNVDWNNNFQANVTAIDKMQPVFIYCKSGGRSAEAADYLRKNGYEKVYDLDGGIMSWRAANMEISSDTTLAKPDSGLTLAQFESLLVADKYVIVDFYATWCGPCRMMEPALEDIAKTMADKVIVVRIDVDKNEELAKHFEVESLPTIQIYKNKKLIWEDMGARTKKQLVSQLK